MLGSLRIQGFRAFASLTAEPLARVNLFVGKNNAGKSSVLEAAEIFARRGSAAALWAVPVRRGEVLVSTEEGVSRVDADVRRLFLGHQLREGVSFRVGPVDAPAEEVECSVIATRTVDLSKIAPPFRLSEAGASGIGLEAGVGDDRAILPLSPEGGLRQTYSNGDGLPRVHSLGNDQPPARFLTGPGAALWQDVVLTPSEDQVTAALRIIEPRIERLAAAPRPGDNVEFFVKLRGADARVPLASMGDGLKRLLALALATVTSAGGWVLVDDIDTGLHHSVMERMWQMVIETARALDVQVMATTHSLDCVTSLARLFERSPGLRDAVAVHRLEGGRDRTVVFSAEDVVVAARHEMDLR